MALFLNDLLIWCLIFLILFFCFTGIIEEDNKEDNKGL